MNQIAPPGSDARPEAVPLGRLRRWGVPRYTGVAVVGVVALAWAAAALGQRPGISGMLDRLAELDGSLRWSEWWALPLVDGVVGLGVVLGGIAAARRADPGGRSVQVMEHGFRSVGWIGVFVATVSVGAVAAMSLNVGATQRDDSVSRLVLLAVLSVGVALAEGSVVARGRAMLVVGAASPASEDPPMAGAWVAGIGVLALGAATHGFVAVAAMRLALQAVAFAVCAGRRDRAVTR